MADTYEFRFRRRYNLPPTDQRFLDATLEEMKIDFWAHRFLDDPELRKEHVTDDYDAQLAAMEKEEMALGSPVELLAKREGAEPEPAGEAVADPAPPQPAPAGNVQVTQEVISMKPEDAPDDWETEVDDRYGGTAGLS